MKTTKKLMTLLLVMLSCMSINAQDTMNDETYPPQFPGGDAALISFLNENIQYPLKAAQDRIEGKVVVQFLVKKTGKIGKIKVLRSVSKELDEEAVRLVKTMPDFIPGKQNGEVIDMLYTVPVSFKLFEEMVPLYSGEIEGDTTGVPKDFQPPMFPGGEEALMQFLKMNVKYPPSAAKKNVQGRVVTQFVVDKTGKIGEIKIVNSVDKALDAEAIRVCKQLPDFYPALQNGEPISVWFTLPITFKLD
jgi:TonB family protein